MSLAPPVYDLHFGDNPRQRLDVYPATSGQHPVVLFWYGGGWQHGDKHTYRFVGRTLQRMGYTVVIANYRLYPEASFPAFIADGALAVQWAHQNIADYHGDPSRLVLMGHSAGAHLAAYLAYESRWLKEGKVPLDTIKAFVGLAGPYDFTPGPRYRAVFNLNDPRRAWSPVNVMDRFDVPALLLQGRLDPIVAPDNARSLAEKIGEGDGQATVRVYPHLEHMLLVGALARPLKPLGVQADLRRFLFRLFGE